MHPSPANTHSATDVGWTQTTKNPPIIIIKILAIQCMLFCVMGKEVLEEAFGDLPLEQVVNEGVHHVAPPVEDRDLYAVFVPFDPPVLGFARLEPHG